MWILLLIKKAKRPTRCALWDILDQKSAIFLWGKYKLRNGIFRPWGWPIGLFNWREAFSDFMLRCFSNTRRAEGKPSIKKIKTWKLKMLWTNWKVKSKSPGMMEHGFLSQNKIYFIMKTKRASQINFQICEN